MTLAWSMDKLGPIARSIEDFALVFDAIHGADGLDYAAVDQPFAWPPRSRPRKLKSRLLRGTDRRPSTSASELKILRKLGFDLVPITLPDELPVQRDHAHARNRGRRRLRRTDSQACHRGLEHLARDLPPGTVRPGSRIPAGRAGANATDARDGRAAWRRSTSTSAPARTWPSPT